MKLSSYSLLIMIPGIIVAVSVTVILSILHQGPAEVHAKSLPSYGHTQAGNQWVMLNDDDYVEVCKANTTWFGNCERFNYSRDVIAKTNGTVLDIAFDEAQTTSKNVGVSLLLGSGVPADLAEKIMTYGPDAVDGTRFTNTKTGLFCIYHNVKLPDGSEIHGRMDCNSERIVGENP